MLRHFVTKIRPLTILLGLQFLLFLFLYLNPQHSYQHIEQLIFNNCAIRDEPKLTAMSPLRYFSNIGCLETDSRSRGFNMLLLGLNIHFRIQLFDWGILHPSLSLSWLMGIFLSPLALFYLVRLLFLSEWIALAVASLFLISIGNISSFVMLFHPGKPFTTLAVILSLYLIKLMQQIPKKKYIVFLFIFIFLGGQSDETYYILAPLIPLFFPDLLFKFKTYWKLNLTILLSFLFNLVFLTFIYRHLGEILIPNYTYQFDFWHYAFGSNESMHHFDFSWIPFNLNKIILGHGSAAFIIAGIHFLFASGKRLFLLRQALIFLLFVVFQTLVLTRRGGVLYDGPYYWGILSSLFICLYIASALYVTDFNSVWKKGAGLAVILILIGVFANRSFELNTVSKENMEFSHAVDNPYHCFWNYGKDVYGDEPQRLKAAWESRASENALAMADTLPHDYHWYKNELMLWRWQNKYSTDLVSCIGR
jgi:hypothetical protein